MHHPLALVLMLIGAAMLFATSVISGVAYWRKRGSAVLRYGWPFVAAGLLIFFAGILVIALG